MDMEKIKSMKGMTCPQIANLVAGKFLSNVIDKESLRAITEDAYNYDVPLEKVNKNTYLIRLDRDRQLHLRILLQG